MLCGTDNIPRSFPDIQSECGEYPRVLRGILSLPHNIVMDLNNVMDVRKYWICFQPQQVCAEVLFSGPPSTSLVYISRGN